MGLIYFEDGELIAQYGKARVYLFNGELYLEAGQGHSLWTYSLERKDYEKQIANKAKGKCLEIGLGLGIASAYILSLPNVDTLTTVEKNNDIINVYKLLQERDYASKDSRHNILWEDGLEFMRSIHIRHSSAFDFIFLDYYTDLDHESLVELYLFVSVGRRILNPGGKIVGWLDNTTPESIKKDFINIFEGVS